MALVNAFKNNGYRLVDRTLLNTIEMATRVIDVVNGVKISYDGNVMMGHFNNFTLDEDAEHPYLLTYNFEFVISAYGTSSSPSGSDLSHNGMNEIYGHYLQTEDDIAFEVKYYNIRLLSDFDNYFTNAAIVEPTPSTKSKDLRDLWALKTGLPWDVAVAHKWDKDPSFLYYSLISPDAFDNLMKDINGNTPQPTEFSSSLTSDTQSLINAAAITLEIDPLYMTKAIAFETGGTFDPLKKNPRSNAIGLIQITDGATETIFGKKGFHTSADLIAAYPTVESQLTNVVIPYFQYQARHGVLLDTQQAVSMAIFWPTAAHWDPDTAFPFTAKQAAANYPIVTVEDYMKGVYKMAVLPTTKPPPAAGDTPEDVAKNSSKSAATRELINNSMNPLSKYNLFPPIRVQ
jgi:hypothetical protein